MIYTLCEVCGKRAIHRHHVMFGTANRKLSEKYGLVAFLCMECHQTVHSNRSVDLILKRRYQAMFELVNGHDTWMKIFMRNYL